jgi:hypothetical protein
MGQKIQVPRDWAHDAVWQKIVDDSGHWFDVDTMRFFNCRISWGSIIQTQKGYAFISSERNDMTNAPRFYSIREWVRATGRIDTIGGFQEYATARDARVALHTLIARGLL